MISGRRSSITEGAIERAGFTAFALIALLPIALSLAYALAYSVGLAGLLNHGFTTEYWGRLAGSSEILRSFAISLAVALVVVAASVALALVLALYLRGNLGGGPLGYAIYLPLALPGTVLAFVMFQLLSGAGLLARIAAGLGLIATPAQFPGLVNDQLGTGIIIAETFVAVPFFMILFAQLYETERLAELKELAASLGAGRMQSLRRVAVPILLARAFPTIVLYLVAVLGAYEVPLLLGPGSPQMISVLTMRKYAMFDLAQKPEAFICAIIYTAVSFGLIALAYRRVRFGDDA